MMIDAQAGLRCSIDAHQIISRLWQGSFPEPGDKLRNCGFDVLVLCAEEVQPPASLYPNIEVIYAGIDDGNVTPKLERTARRASRQVLKAIRVGKRVLVTCAQGRNRSGLVIGLALKKLIDGDVVNFIQRRRPNALTNPYFVELLQNNIIWLELPA